MHAVRPTQNQSPVLLLRPTRMEQKLQIIKLDAKTHELLDELAIVEAILCRSECSSCQFMHV